MSFPDGFDTSLSQAASTCPAARSSVFVLHGPCCATPAVLILDDSTSAVDSTTEGLIRESFKKNLKGTTVIIIDPAYQLCAVCR